MTVPAMPQTPVSAQDAGVVVSANRFPRAARVRAKAEFTAVFESGRRTAEPRMALHWLADAEPARLGLAVSRKVDPHAVGRNRIKRALREAFERLLQRAGALPPPPPAGTMPPANPLPSDDATRSRGPSQPA